MLKHFLARGLWAWLASVHQCTSVYDVRRRN